MSAGGRPKKSKDVEYTCRECGETYTRPEWHKTGKKFCSKSCYHASRAGVTPVQKAETLQKVCPNCSIEFLVGGKGRPHRDNVYCSRECAQGALNYQPPPRRLSDVEAVWLAAMVDGEGSIVRLKHRSAQSVRLTVYNNDQRLVDRCYEITGTGRMFAKDRGNPKWQITRYWQCYGSNARDLLKQMLPWLISKRDKALIALGEEPDA